MKNFLLLLAALTVLIGSAFLVRVARSQVPDTPLMFSWNSTMFTPKPTPSQGSQLGIVSDLSRPFQKVGDVNGFAFFTLDQSRTFIEVVASLPVPAKTTDVYVLRMSVDGAYYDLGQLKMEKGGYRAEVKTEKPIQSKTFFEILLRKNTQKEPANSLFSIELE